MDGGDLAVGQSENLIGSGMEVESRVDDSKLVGAGVDGVGEAVVVVKGGEEQVEMPLVAGLEILPAVAAPVVGQVITPVVDQAMEKKKRGRPSRGYVPKLPAPKMIKEEEEDVCFICFDGGSLVLCDRKGCPKAYHPACIKREEAFFSSKTRWDCGWHICSVCEKPSHHFCYTCTYSLCKKCTKNSEYVSVRGSRGFCSSCMKIILMIENKDAGNKESIQVDFDDKSSWEYLFKVYWTVLKTKGSLTLNELMEAKNPWKGVVGAKFKPQLGKKDIAAVGSVPLPILPKSVENSEQKTLPEQNQVPDQDTVSPERRSSEKRKISDGCMDWASQELLEFVAHMRNGDTSILSQFDVQALLMEYIKMNNLRNPHQKSQIICDARLKTLFGKPRVGHIEMLKLLEYHYLITEDTEKIAVIPAGIVGGSGSHVAIDNNSNHSVSNQSKKQKTRKKGEDKASQVNLDEYAAIDNHNVKLIFLRRSMMENLLDQVDKFHDKVVGSIVRIRVSTNDQKQDIYRLVQVVGTSKGAESYKIGDKTTDILLEVLNLDKKETMSIVAISNQEFSEEECRRLRQSIKWGLVKRMTVGDIQTKAMALQSLRFDDWLVAEILRLSHLRDRANEKGHKKELRECVEKLQVLKTPEERQRKLNEIPEVHADPKMNPNYESAEEDTHENDKKRDGVLKRGHSNLSIIGTQLLRPKKSVKEDNNVQRVEKKSNGGGPNCFQHQENHAAAASFGNSSSICSNQSLLRRSDSERAITPPVSQTSSLAVNIQTEKIWHYRDPTGKVQGPFSMVQLQKWSTTGYFPVNMSIWTVNEQNYSIFLNDALGGQFHKNIELFHSIFSEPRVAAGIVTDDGICVGDSLKNLGSETRNNNATAQVGLDSRSFDRIAEPVYNEKQPVNVPCSDLLKNVTDEVNDAEKTEHYSPVSSGQNRLPVLNLDLNSGDCNVVASVMNTSVSSELKVDLDLVELPSPTPKSEIKDLKSQPNEQESVCVDIQAAEMLRSLSARVPTNGTTVSDVRTSTPNPTDEDPPLPSPKPNTIDAVNLPNPEPPELTEENHLGQSSGPPEISLKDLGWTISTSGQDSGEPSFKEWDFGLVPMLKPDASDSNTGRHLDDNLPFHPLPNMSSWQLGIHEPIEFSTLAEESVSDLLAEVDAMESQIGMPPSPSSAMRCGDGNDCFSSIEELSPNTDASKSDAISFPSQQAEIDEHSIGASQIDAFDPVKRTDLHSSTSTEEEAKSGNYPINIWENQNRSDIHPPMNQAMINAAGHNWASVQGNMNMGWAGPPPQAFADVGWRPPLNNTWANPNLSLGSFNGNPGWDNSPHRFNGSRDWQFQGGGGGGGGGGDLGFGRGGGGRPMWSRQQHNNGGGGGSGGSYPRPTPKGPRVCKFYESGHCKKGASCGYLHP